MAANPLRHAFMALDTAVCTCDPYPYDATTGRRLGDRAGQYLTLVAVGSVVLTFLVWLLVALLLLALTFALTAVVIAGRTAWVWLRRRRSWWPPTPMP
ncbi:MAG TPA: hypothetical protein VE983_10790 [Solirubrobacteraceae bacterium]|nr:hypothetical protein [Solirubrobacteraceae bacterium]